MKTKYLFSFSHGQIEESTLFVWVFIGHSKQDLRDKAFFESLAKQSSSYMFRQHDKETAEFVANVTQALQESEGDQRTRALTCSMSAAKLRRLLKSGMYYDWARTYYEATRGLRRMSLCENSAYHCAVYRADQNLCKSANVINLSKLQLAL